LIASSETHRHIKYKREKHLQKTQKPPTSPSLSPPPPPPPQKGLGFRVEDHPGSSESGNRKAKGMVMETMVLHFGNTNPRTHSPPKETRHTVARTGT
jgi:hypothetical protein